MPPPPTEQTFPALAPRVGSEFRASLLQIPTFDDEAIRITVVNIHPTITVAAALIGRFWSDQRREIGLLSIDTTTAPGGVTIRNYPLERGSLLTVEVSATGTPEPTLGNVWIQVQIVKSLTGALSRGGIILQGYASNSSRLVFPGSTIESLHAGKGVIRAVSWTAPSATVARVTVPASRRWRVITGVCSVTADATVGNRGVLCQVYQNPNFIFLSESAVLQPASSNREYSLAPNITKETGASNTCALIPWVSDLELRAGDTIDLALIGPGGPADTLVGDQLNIREWYDPGS